MTNGCTAFGSFINQKTNPDISFYEDSRGSGDGGISNGTTRYSPSTKQPHNKYRQTRQYHQVHSGHPVHAAQYSGAGSARMSLLLLISIFACAASVMYLVYRNFPELIEEEREKIKIPKDMDDAKALGTVLSKYKDTYYTQVLLAYFATFVFLQTFAIPGTIFLSILSGYLYPFPLALFLVCLCSGLGASFCYMLSYLVGRPVVYKYLTEKVQKWSQQVEKHREHLIYYIFFLRITPFLPNWFINITSPVINVPLRVFFLGTFLGVAPPSFVVINAGTTLYKLTTAGEAISWYSLAVLAVLAIVSILPVCFQRKLQEKME